MSVKEELLRQPRKLLDIEFRHHGLGMLQGYLDKNTRIHIWHPGLCSDWTQEPFRAVHDHRYDLRSEVLVGSLIDVSYEVIPYGSWDVSCMAVPSNEWKTTHLWEIVNAKAQRGLSDDMIAQDKGAVLVRETGRRAYSKGDSYTIPRRAFHTTIVDRAMDYPTVTLVTRSQLDNRPARVLGQTGRSAIKNDAEIFVNLIYHAIGMIADHYPRCAACLAARSTHATLALCDACFESRFPRL